MTRPFIIAEAGSNWKAEGSSDTRNFECVRKLVRVAAKVRCDAVKFQYFRELYIDDAGSADYLGGPSINSIIKSNELPSELIPVLAEECKKAGIEFMCTVYEPAHVVLVDPYVKRHKVASYELGYEDLLRAVAKTNKPIIASTGGATEEDVRWANRIFKEEKVQEVTFLQCSLCYPAPLHILNLGVLRLTEPDWGLIDWGFSDHSSDLLAPIVATALGAKVIEKHFTLSRKLRGPDHAFALEPKDLARMVALIEMTVEAIGDYRKYPRGPEMELLKFATRSVQAKEGIQAGDVLTDRNMCVLRPGKRLRGEPARFFSEMCGQMAARKILKGDGVRFEDLRKTPGRQLARDG